jgi:hypothetical protein
MFIVCFPFTGHWIISHLFYHGRRRAPSYDVGLPDHLTLHALINRPAHETNDSKTEADHTTHGERNDYAYNASHDSMSLTAQYKRPPGCLAPDGLCIACYRPTRFGPGSGRDIQVGKELLSAAP